MIEVNEEHHNEGQKWQMKRFGVQVKHKSYTCKIIVIVKWSSGKALNNLGLTIMLYLCHVIISYFDFNCVMFMYLLTYKKVYLIFFCVVYYNSKKNNKTFMNIKKLLINFD